MSESVTNVEIEDVLSSIRRLVSEDIKATSVRAPAPEKQEPAPVENADRLVLVPSFRVAKEPVAEVANAAEPVETVDESQPDAEAKSDGSDEQAAGDNLGVLTLTAENELPAEQSGGDGLASEASETEVLENDALDQVVDQITDEVVHELTAEMQPGGAPDDMDDGTESALEDGLADVAEETTDETADETSVPQFTPDVAETPSRLHSLEATIAELEAAIDHQPNEFEPDGSEEVGSSPEIEPLQWEDEGQSEPASPPEFLHRRAPETAETPTEATPTEAPLETPAEPIAETSVETSPEAAAETTADTSPEPQENPGVSAETVVAFAKEQPPVDDFEELLRETPTPDASETRSDMRAEDGLDVIDPETLHDMVADIVRSELQGVLGERITRNVRKLVRREIHRILSSADLD